MALTATVASPPTAFNCALAQIADLLGTEWSRRRHLPMRKPKTILRPDLLTVALPNALTTCEQEQSSTKDGRLKVKQQLDELVDGVYPRLAGQVEALLRCYVTWTAVDIAPDNSTVHVRIGLRDLPMI
jgi:hypothetical protein